MWQRVELRSLWRTAAAELKVPQRSVKPSEQGYRTMELWSGQNLVETAESPHSGVRTMHPRAKLTLDLPQQKAWKGHHGPAQPTPPLQSTNGVRGAIMRESQVRAAAKQQRNGCIQKNDQVSKCFEDNETKVFSSQMRESEIYKGRKLERTLLYGLERKRSL